MKTELPFYKVAIAIALGAMVWVAIVLGLFWLDETIGAVDTAVIWISLLVGAAFLGRYRGKSGGQDDN